MAQDHNRKTARRPTKRSERKTTLADAHYSKLTRKASSQTGFLTASESENQASEAPDDSQAAQQIMSYETLSYETRQRVYGKRERRQHTSNKFGTFFALFAVAAFILAGLYVWTHRTVRITVNDQSMRIRINSSLAELYTHLDIETIPGNYVTVGGNLIEEGAGYWFSARIGDKDYAGESLANYKIHGGEHIEILDGTDRIEPYDVSYREVQPRLSFEVEDDWGTISYVRQWGKPGEREVRTGKESGEVADGDWKEPLKDFVVVTKRLHPAGDKKLVALTFDDGPAPSYTEQCLDILAEKGAKATFFCVPEKLSERPDLGEKIADSGNQVCIRSNLTAEDAETLLAEIRDARSVTKDATGVDTTIFRPSNGLLTRESWLLTQGEVSAVVRWTQDSVDWSIPGVNEIVQNALQDVGPGSIILMHDGGGNRDQSIEALPQIIDSLQQRGYELVTLSELLASDPDVPDDLVFGDSSLPSNKVWPTEIGS